MKKKTVPTVGKDKILFEVMPPEEIKEGLVIIPDTVKGETVVCKIRFIDEQGCRFKVGQTVHLQPFMEGQTFTIDKVKYAVGVSDDIWYGE